MHTRRTFCVNLCQASSLAAAAALLQACGNSSPTSPSGNVTQLPTVNGSVVNNAVVVNIDSSSPLASVGGLALLELSVGAFLIARTAQDAFMAVTAMCTHQACLITGQNGTNYVCPCHGSQFSTSGGVLSGPATVALQQYASQFANNVLTINLVNVGA